MDPADGTSKASNLVSEDVLSSMPNIVITNILDRLPLQDAVKTSILSKIWSLKWTNLLTQLVFDGDFIEYLSESGADEPYHGRIIISKILLQLKGAIRKFTLHIHDKCYFEDIGTWVMFLSQKGIEEFTLINFSRKVLILPTHLYSCRKLKYLELEDCCFPVMSDSYGFPNLLSLKLHKVRDSSHKFGEFLNQSPLLEILEITGNSFESSSIFHLGAFSKLRGLALDFGNSKLFAENGHRKMVSANPATLHCLKTLSLDSVDFCSAVLVSCAIELICDSPNLQTLQITTSYTEESDPPRAFCSSEVEMGQLQLREVELNYIYGCENEVCFIKSLLLSSPFLEKMTITAQKNHPYYEVVEFATTLLTLHRASPIAAIHLR